MPVNINELTPYLSVIVLKIDDNTFNINKLFELLANNNRSIQTSTHSSGAIIYFKNYTETKKVSWSSSNLTDTINHLMIVFKIDDYLAFYHSDNSKKNTLYKLIFRGPLGHEFKKLKLIRKEVLNAAFINNVKVKNLWLNNIDKSSDLKADSKVLSGKNLEEALDPLGDSNYAFSSLKVELGDESIGINTSDSKIWTKKYSDSDEYFDSLEILLNSIKDCDINNTLNFEPISTLANSHTNITEINSLLDIQLSNIEEFEHQSDEYILLNRINHLWDTWSFIYSSSGNTFIVDIYDNPPMNTNKIAIVRFNLVNNSELIHIKAIKFTEIKDIYNLRQVFENKDIIKFWFNDNYSLINGLIFKQKFRDVSFKNFEWHAFQYTDVSKEKPSNLSLVGQQDSLFCWVKKYWKGISDNFVDINQQFVPGWLMCDDGANEKADFIHITNEAVPTISFIHAKGANTNSTDRNISTTAYEVVVSQSIKNLRYIDKNLLSETIELSPSVNVNNLVWHNGSIKTRTDLKNYINTLSNYKKRVVILQPHLIKDKFENTNHTAINKNRVNQLNTLFVSAQITIQSLGAEFLVIADGNNYDDPI